LADYADSYTLSGCHSNFFCGVFTRVEAHCTVGSGARCPGGASAAGNADPALCDGAPVYQNQNAHGWVLLRLSEGGGTRWKVSPSDGSDGAIHHCEWHENQNHPRGHSRGLEPGSPGLRPDGAGLRPDEHP
jgi:hypothetical protein